MDQADLDYQVDQLDLDVPSIHKVREFLSPLEILGDLGNQGLLLVHYTLVILGCLVSLVNHCLLLVLEILGLLEDQGCPYLL